MSTTVTLSYDEYSMLLDFAYGRRSGLSDLRALQKRIDDKNSIKRYLLNIRWMEIGGVPPSRIELKDAGGWPPQQEFILRQDRPISRNDVDIVLGKQATNPVSVTVTSDERGIVGWTELEVWDFNANV